MHVVWSEESKAEISALETAVSAATHVGQLQKRFEELHHLASDTSRATDHSVRAGMVSAHKRNQQYTRRSTNCGGNALKASAAILPSRREAKKVSHEVGGRKSQSGTTVTALRSLRRTAISTKKEPTTAKSTTSHELSGDDSMDAAANLAKRIRNRLNENVFSRHGASDSTH